MKQYGVTFHAVTCGFTCHTRVAAKVYIFTAYGKR